MLRVRRLAIPDVVEIVPHRTQDERGFFSETWNAAQLVTHGIETTFVQDNQSLSRNAGVLRGLHYQEPPFAQAKLIRVIRGAIFDVAVDIRHGSPTFAHWVGHVLSEQEWNQVLVPEGFAHGFLTLEPDTEVSYKVSAPYSPAHDRSICWSDPTVGVEWPLGSALPILSAKDRQAPALKDTAPAFRYCA